MKKISPKKIRATVAGYLFISPVIVGMLVFSLVPLIESFYTSFTLYDNVSAHQFVGFQNYAEMFNMPLFWKAFKNTVVYACVSIPVNIVCSFFLAWLLNFNVKGVKIYRALFYSPCIIPIVASTVVFADLFNPTFGWFNQILKAVGLPPYTFMTKPETAMPSMIIYSMWSMGGSMLIWLSCFNSIPKELYEAAAIDGANGFQKLMKFTVPLSTPIIFYNLVMGIIGGLQLFAQVYLLTNGGPLDSTLTVVMMIYNYGINYMEMGIASAMAWFLAIVIVILTVITFITRKYWVYGEEDK